MDAFHNYLQSLATQELSVKAILIWCMFGKLPLYLAMCLYYDDRVKLITYYCLVSTLVLFV